MAFTKSKLGLAAVVLLCTGVWWWSGERSASDAPDSSEDTATPSSPGATSDDSSPSAGDPVSTRSPDPSSQQPPSPLAGPVVFGVVRSGGQPVAGIELRASRSQYGPIEEYGRVVTLEDGRYRIPLPSTATLSPPLRACSRLVVRASGAGYRTDSQSFELHDDGTSLEHDIELSPGFHLRGRVVDSGGAPVPEAEVQLTDCSATPRRDHGSTGDDGRFAMPLRVAARHRLEVAAFGRGVARPIEFEVELDADLELGHVLLAGTARLGGQVHAGTGEPIAELEVRARRDDTEDPGLHFANQRPEGDERGLTHDRAFTDAQGRFVLQGLSPGSYHLAFPEALVSEMSNRRQWSEQTFETGREDHRIVLERSRLVLRIRDEDGRPLCGAGYSLEIEVPGSDQAGRMTGTMTEADAERSLPLPPGSRVRASVSVGDLPVAEGVVEILPSPADTVLELIVHHCPPATGRLEIVLTDVEGGAIETGSLSLESLVGGGTPPGFHQHSFQTREGPIEVPVGRYRATILPGEPAFRGATLGWHFASEYELSIEADRSTRIELAARAGGRFALTVHVPAGADPDLERAKVLHLLPGGEERSVHPFVTHIPKGTVTRHFRPPHPDGGVWMQSPIQIAGLRSSALPLFPAGTLELRVEVPGYEPAPWTTSIVPGSTVDGEIWLQPVR